MAEEIDPSVIKKTQEILGSVIRKPVLTEKSLKKPPFRFLHDIITNVIKTSGFLKGLYTADELQSENVKDKETKIQFLQKAVDVLTLVTNQSLNLKPSKVVAGHDPQKTNLFLQVLGTAAKNKLDSSEAVEKVLSGKFQSSPTKAVKERRVSIDKRSKGSSEKSHSRSLTKTLEPVKKVTTSQSKETSKTKDAEKATKDKNKDSKKDREKSKDRSKHKTEDSKKTSKDKSSKNKDASHEDENKNGKPVVSEINGTIDVKNHVPNSDLVQEPSTSMINGNTHDEPTREKSHRQHSTRSARPPSAHSKRKKPSSQESTVAVQPEYPSIAANETSFENTLLPSFRPPSARAPSARPSSSRPAPPRIRVRHVTENQEPVLRPVTAKPVENVILDQNHVSDEEEETFLVMESETTDNLDVQVPKLITAETPEEDKGSLVKKLLETKKDLEGGSQQSPTKKTEIDRSQQAESRRSQSASKEMTQLRGFVQSLSRTAIPLGRMLDFLQEDIDSMKMELRIWREEHEQNLHALHKEQSATESLLEPLRAQLDDLDQVVQNQLEANSALKASIAKNDDRIHRMLNSLKHKS